MVRHELKTLAKDITMKFLYAEDLPSLAESSFSHWVSSYVMSKLWASPYHQASCVTIERLGRRLRYHMPK